MQTTKKKPGFIMVFAGALAAVYVGYLAGGAWQEGIDFKGFASRLNMVCADPFGNYYNQYTFKTTGFMLFVYAIVVIMYYTSQKNYMPGREYGTSKLADVKKVNAAIADKEESKNRILGQGLRISLDTRHTGLNNNVLVIGGFCLWQTIFFF